MDHAVIPRCVLGKRKRFPPDPLAQGVVPALHLRDFAGLLADAQVMCFGKDAGIGLPEVAESATTTVSFGHPAPKHPAGRLAPVAVDVGHYLPASSGTTPSMSTPCCASYGHNRTLRQVPGHSRAAPRPVRQPPLAIPGVSFSHAATVGRDTPKTRQTPCRQTRSWYARRISCLRPSLYRTVGSSTLQAPQSLQRYCWLPDALRPFLTMFSLWQERHLCFTVIFIIGLWEIYNVTYHLKFSHYRNFYHSFIHKQINVLISTWKANLI